MKIEVECDRCHTLVQGYQTENATGGFYRLRHNGIPTCWAQYAWPWEEILCDACMWADERYQKIYGHIGPRRPADEHGTSPESEAWKTYVNGTGG